MVAFDVIGVDFVKFAYGIAVVEVHETQLGFRVPDGEVAVSRTCEHQPAPVGRYSRKVTVMVSADAS